MGSIGPDRQPQQQEPSKARLGYTRDAFYGDGTRTLRNTVGKDLSQWFDVEPHMSTAALAGVTLGRMYPSVLTVNTKASMSRRLGRAFVSVPHCHVCGILQDMTEQNSQNI